MVSECSCVTYGPSPMRDQAPIFDLLYLHQRMRQALMVVGAKCIIALNIEKLAVRAAAAAHAAALTAPFERAVRITNEYAPTGFSRMERA
jgi:hypothetical protein